MTADTYPLTADEVKLLNRVATNCARKWPWVNRDDVVQELWVWAMKNVKWIVRYRDTEVEPHGPAKLNRAMYKAGTTACMTEEAARLHKRKEELLDHCPAYSRDVVKTLLPIVWSTEDWPQAQVHTRPGTEQSLAADGFSSQIEEVRDMLMDISNAVARLPKRDQQILRLAFSDGVSAATLAKYLDVRVEAAWKAKERALDRLLRFL